MKPYQGGRRTRIRATRSKHRKRHYKRRVNGYYYRSGEHALTPSGSGVLESMAREKISVADEQQLSNER